jgi:hypothetical protein
MEPSSPSSTGKEILEAQLRECFGRVVYSHKTHEKCADILLRRLSWLKHTQIILSVVLSGTLLRDLVGHQPTGIVPAILAGLLTFVNLYFRNFDYGRIAEAHKSAADQLWNTRESYQSLIGDFLGGIIDTKDATKRRDQLQERLSAIYSKAPRTNSNAYKKAQTALKYSEDMTFSTAEIDAFLPGPLKKGTG